MEELPCLTPKHITITSKSHGQSSSEHHRPSGATSNGRVADAPGAGPASGLQALEEAQVDLGLSATVAEEVQ